MRRLSLGLMVVLAVSCSPGSFNPGPSQSGGSGGTSGNDPGANDPGQGNGTDPGQGGTGGTGGTGTSTDPDAGTTAAPCTGGDAQATDPATGHCYVYFAATLAWDAAQTACTNLGTTWHLATLTSATEQNLVAPLVGQNETWIGFSNNGQTDPTTFVWVTQEPTLYTDWATGEPNGGAIGNCARIKPAAADQWADALCTSLHSYLCERD